MTTLNEEIFRLKEIMGLEEGPDGPAYKVSKGYDDGCDCYPEDQDVIEGEIDEEAEAAEQPEGEAPEIIAPVNTPTLGSPDTAASGAGTPAGAI